MTDSTTRTYKVTGMSCEHCRSAVAEEISAIDGVEDVTVDLENGTAVVTGAEVEDDAVRAAVDEAGYELAPA